MALLIVYGAIVLGSVAVAAQDSSVQQPQPCGRYYDVDPGFRSDAMFTLLPLNDVMFTQNVLSEVSSRSEIDCGRECVGAEGCVMLTFQHREKGASGRCRVYGQVHNATQDHEVSPGARSYVLDTEAGSAFGRLHNGYSMKSGRCIRVLSENLSYQNATQRCLQLDGGHLLFTKTADDLQFGQSILADSAPGFEIMWVGVDDLEKQGDFQWTDGTPLSSHSSLWGLAEPDNLQGSQHCVCVWRAEGKLHDWHCENSEQYPAVTVCQREV